MSYNNNADIYTGNTGNMFPPLLFYMYFFSLYVINW